MNAIRQSLSAFLVMSLTAFLFVGTTQAVTTTTMADVDIRDFYVTELGSTLEYSIEERTSEGVFTSTGSVDLEACDTPAYNCVQRISEEGDVTETVVTKDAAIVQRHNGVEVDYLDLSKEDFEYDLGPDYLEAMGLDSSFFSGFNVSCTHIYHEEMTYRDLTLPTIQQDCTMLITDIENDVYDAYTRGYFMKGYGAVSSALDMYYGDTLFYSLVQTLDTFYHAPPFSDLNYTHKNFDAIMYLYQEGIISGYPDGTFQAGKTVNRAELLKILVEGNGVTPDPIQYQNCFSDVTDTWFAKYVCYAKEQGWVEGYPDGLFRPADTVNKVEALKMLLNSQSMAVADSANAPFDDVPSDQWFAKYVSEAKNLGLLEETGSLFYPDGDMARGGISENLYRLLNL